MAQELFYSGDEKILFWVAGYTDNSQHVNDIISVLTNLRDHFKRIGGKGTVKTDVINESRRYKHMRVFWCENIEDKDVPSDAFRITGDNGWTMWKWLRD